MRFIIDQRGRVIPAPRYVETRPVSHTRIEMQTMDAICSMANKIRGERQNPVVGLAACVLPNTNVEIIAVRADGDAYRLTQTNDWHRLPDVPNAREGNRP